MSEHPNPLEALKAAVARVGSQSATARLLGVTQAAVWGWLNRGTPIPGEHALKLSDETKIPKEQLRPDIYRPTEASIPANLEPTR